MTDLQPLDAAHLPPGIRARYVPDVNGLTVHVLEAGHESSGRPLLLLLHGFPELAYSWRKVIGPLAAAGFHVVAPDQRGYGRTTGWDADYDGDLAPYRMLNLVRDALGLVAALGHREAAAVIGHDFGASVAAWAPLVRPDVFRAAATMSAPFDGPPNLPEAASGRLGERPDIHQALAALPRPRKHYQWYYSTRQANADMRDCPQGVHAFLRGYFHYKSAHRAGNRPFPLASWTAGELAKMPTYYIMDHDRTMAETVAASMPSSAEIASCSWLTEQELAVYSAEYARTGFQGGLQWYRVRTSGAFRSELELFAGRRIEVPSLFIAGESDWGIYQRPGAFERMPSQGFARLLGTPLVKGAGHWVQQEQPEAVTALVLDLLRGSGSFAAPPPPGYSRPLAGRG
ncbi:MAG: alpha/beta fold hydrolase [Alphaproteobacteria bacterium]|nr:alpha/beta fold hydrolase [Alphaproteobacteria bacterium]